MTTAPIDRDDDRGDRRRGAGEQAERDAGDRDVADAVAHQGEPALHEVGADGRGGEPGEQRAEQRPDHEVVGQQAHRLPLPVQRRGDRRGVVGPRGAGRGRRGGGRAVRSASVNASIGGPSYATRPSRITSARSTRGPSGPSSWATSTIVAPRATWRRSASANACWLCTSTPGGRLVEDEQVGVAGEGAGDQHALLLAAGQRGDAVAGLVGEADGRDRGLDGLPVRPALRARTGGGATAARRRPPRGPRRARRTRRWPAAGRTRRAASRRNDVERGAEQPDLAAAGRDQAHHRADQRGLAGAVGAEDGEHLARGARRGRCRAGSAGRRARRRRR